jgi:beta-glucosidase/6-phospho-beta-glucosidase/beta-galactosidase
VPLQTKNESWKFPKDFWYGVAGAAYQIEGAVKAEGRGPSIWDVLTHRVPNYVVTNDTGDVADNNYYYYKQGKYSTGLSFSIMRNRGL